MEVTLEDLLKINRDELSFVAKKMLDSTIKWVKSNGGKAFVHCHVLKDLGVDINKKKGGIVHGRPCK